MNNQRAESYLRYCHQFSKQWRGDYDGYIDHTREWQSSRVLSPEEQHLLNHLVAGGGYNPVWPDRGEPAYSWMASWKDDTRAVLSDNACVYLYFTN